MGLTKAQKEAKKAAEAAEAQKLANKKKIRDEIWAIVILALGVFLILSIFTTSTGGVGNVVSGFLGGVFGKVAYVLPFYLIIFGILIFAQKTAYLTWRTSVFSLILFVLLSCLFARYTAPFAGAESFNVTWTQLKEIYSLGVSGGGFLGVCIGGIILNAFGTTGLWIICIAGMLIAILFIADTPLSALFDNLKIKAAARRKVKEEQMEMILAAKEESNETNKAEEEKKEESSENDSTKAASVWTMQKPVTKEDVEKEFDKIAAEVEFNKASSLNIPEFDNEPASEEPEEVIPEEPAVEETSVFGDEYNENQKNILNLVTDEDLFSKPKTYGKGLEPASPKSKVSSSDVAAAKDDVAKEIEKSKAKPTKYRFPSIELLSKPGRSTSSKGSELDELAAVLENTLATFGVNATVVDVTRGPAVTRFEVQPALGVKVSSILRLHDDLALNLKAKSLRIEAPIPGKAAVGIEISNDSISMVTLREIVESREFKNHKSKIAVAVGKSINGEPIVANIKDMPHLLIAGSTGSGKSVCINSMLISLLYHATPAEVKLILIDPKVVELSDYNGIPHLLIPVVTEPAKASAALAWAVAEMNNRYDKFANEGVRDLESYNERVRANLEPEKVMPQIIIVIDELNDLMMAAKNSVEDSICRIAQKARAAGMHLVVATQRPSVNVITGVIKANIPSRIAFAVSNFMDSKTILDEGGAEHLLGKGDMLYAPQGSSKPLRVQGCFVSDNEVKTVIESVKASNMDNNYNEDVITAISKAGGSVSVSSDDEDDEMLRDAIECVVREGECSTSMLQRRFRIGYNHAARLVDTLEERGIIGPADGQRKRKVNMTLEEWQASLEPDDGVEEEI